MNQKEMQSACMWKANNWGNWIMCEALDIDQGRFAGTFTFGKKMLKNLLNCA